MRVQLLGELEATDDEGAPVDVRGVKQRTLLAALALHRGQPVSSDRLVDVIWADTVPANPANALQAQVAQLRRTLGAGSIVTRQGGYALAGEVDIDDFERLVNDGRQLLARGDPRAAARVLQDALSLCRGEPLADFTFAEFARPERARLEELRLSALEARLETDLSEGLSGYVVAELEALCDEHPLRERLWALKMTALYQSGRQADALRAYADARRILVDELGVDPGPELQELEAMVLGHDPRLHAPPGEHGSGQRLGNLPDVPTRFVGRQHELGQLTSLTGPTRLVTLVGPGGAGKTRLAVEGAAAMSSKFTYGAWMVELAAVADPAAVTAVIATTLGTADQGDSGRSPGALSTLDTLISHLVGRSVLIVLDNCEHMIAEAARITDKLVRALPELRVMATSREPLNIPGETLVAVGPLPLHDALELFTDRARAVAPEAHVDADGSGLATELCRRVDGLPLAIELAAARLRALPLAQLTSRLDDRFRLLTGGARTSLPRHQTLRAVVDWSYALLFSDEQRLFRRLASFVGTFALDDAEAICADDDLLPGEVLELLGRLVDKSLVVAVEGPDARFSVLQTLRQYADERLAESGEADLIRSRHAAHYRRMGQAGREGLRGATGPLWRERLTSQLGNLRAALDWLITADDAEGALALTAGMAWLWFWNTEFAEGVRWLEDALEAPGARSPEGDALAHAWHGYLVCMSASPIAGARECAAAASAVEPSTDLICRAETLLLYATVLMRTHEFERSLDVLADARRLLDRVDHPWMVATHDMLAAISLVPLGRLEEAEQVARSSLERFDALGEVMFSVDSLNMLAAIAEGRGDLDAAGAIHEDTLARCRAAGRRNYVAFRLLRLAALRARQGRNDTADALYEEAISYSFNPWHSAEAMVGQAAVARRLGDLPRARRLLEAARAHYDAADLGAGRAAVLAGLTWWFLAADQLADGLRTATEAVAVASECQDPAVALMAETALAAAKAALDGTQANVDAFTAVTRQRGEPGQAFGGLIDEPDLTWFARRLAATHP